MIRPMLLLLLFLLGCVVSVLVIVQFRFSPVDLDNSATLTHPSGGSRLPVRKPVSNSTGGHREGGRPRVAICSVFKYESPYLLEWIAAHHLLGVSKFYLFDDQSGDDPEFELSELIASGLVDFERVSPRVHAAFQADVVNPHQGWVFSRCVRQLAPRDHIDWLLLIDVDEFLYVDPVGEQEPIEGGGGPPPPPPLRGRLTALLAQPGWDQVGGVDLTSLGFGANGQIEPPDGPTTASYWLRERLQEFTDVKCFLRVGRQLSMANHACHTDPAPVMANRLDQPVSLDPDLPLVRRGPATLHPLTLFHYRVRSLHSCAAKALWSHPRDYKRLYAVSNCVELMRPESYGVDEDTRLKRHVVEIMAEARCVHPRWWHCRFGRQFPELAAGSVSESCPSHVFGLSRSSASWQLPNDYEGNWLRWELDGGWQNLTAGPVSPGDSPRVNMKAHCGRRGMDYLAHFSPYSYSGAGVDGHLDGGHPVDHLFWDSVKDEANLGVVFSRLVDAIINEWKQKR